MAAHRHSLEIVKYSNRDYYGPIVLWLLTPSHKLFHCFPALIQPTPFRPTASSLVLKLIQEIKTLTFEQDGEIQMLDVTCWNLTHHRNFPLISCIIEPKGDVCCDNHREYFQKER